MGGCALCGCYGNRVSRSAWAVGVLCQWITARNTWAWAYTVLRTPRMEYDLMIASFNSYISVETSVALSFQVKLGHCAEDLQISTQVVSYTY